MRARYDFAEEHTFVLDRLNHLFEKKLEDFLSTKGYTSDQFMKACQEAAEKGVEEDENAAFLTFLLALIDYSTFVQMMKETAGIE